MSGAANTGKMPAHQASKALPFQELLDSWMAGHMAWLKEFVCCKAICWGYAQKMQGFSQLFSLHPLAML